MGDLKLDLNTDNILSDAEDTGGILGVELLANQKTTKSIDTSPKNSTGGYSSGGEESLKTSKEDYDFFKDNSSDNKVNEDIPLKENIKNVSVPPADDPMINQIKGSSNGGEFKPLHSMNSQEIKNEKIDLIYKFKKLEDQGIRTTINYNMNSQLEDMRNEYIKLKKQREVANSVKFQRKVMMAAVTGFEFLNSKFDPFDIKLDGWSESINENIIDYDEVFEELSEKYSGKSEIAPEIKLLMMLGGSAFMFHLTNTMFKSSIPGMGDIMKQNPDLMKQFAKAAVGSIGKQPETMDMRQQRQPFPRSNDPRQSPGRPQSRPEPQVRKRPDMNGPENIDSLMNQMNLQPNDMPDLDNISIISEDHESGGGFTLNL